MQQLRLHGRWQTTRIAQLRTGIGQALQALAGGLTFAHHLAWVLVPDFIQFKAAALSYRDGGSQPLRRIELGQTLPGPQMRLSIGEQSMTTFAHGPTHGHSRDHIVQGLARTHMHEYRACRHDGHSRQS